MSSREVLDTHYPQTWDNYITEGSLEVKLPTIWTHGKAEVGRIREEKKREDQRRERVRRKKMQVCEKVAKSRNTALSQWFVASARHCGAKHISKSRCTKHTILGTLLEVEMSKKYMPLWREALLDVQMSFRVAGARDFAPCQQWAKRGHSVAVSNVLARVELLKRIWKDAFSVAGAVQETCSSEMLGGQGADFLKEVAFWSIGSSVFSEDDTCSTLYDLASLFRGRRSTLHRRSGKIAKRIGTRPSALHFTFHFWRKSRRIDLFLMSSVLKIEEALQNCYVFDVVNFENWGVLSDLLRFSCCHLRKSRKSRRIAAFSSLQIDRYIDKYNYNYH